MPGIGSFEYAPAAERKAAIFADEINVVNGVVSSQAVFDPTGAAIVRVGQKAAVAADPAALRIAEVNSIQILSARDHMSARPAALRVADDRAGEKAAANGQHNFEASFPDHRLKRVLHIKPQFNKSPETGLKTKALAILDL
jgi:hypothetical protein